MRDGEKDIRAEAVRDEGCYEAGELSSDSYFTSVRERSGDLSAEAPRAAAYELNARGLGWSTETGWDVACGVSPGALADAGSDERLCELVFERLNQAGIDLGAVTIRVRDGDVFLEGSVQDAGARYRAEEQVERIMGVKEVDNRLEIANEASGDI